MITKKFKYFLLIESIKDIDLKNIKIRNKFSIIYRNHGKIDNLYDLLKFRRQCKLKAIKFYIANNNALAVTLNSDGIYLSSFNKKLNVLCYKKAKYEIIAGERRWLAASKAGLHDIPVIITEADDLKSLEFAIVENVQRHDLNPLEEAMGYKRLIDEFSYDQEKVSKFIGKSRSYITNSLRLLNLPAEVIKLVEEKKITSGHAKILVGLENATFVANKILEKKLSVRQTENFVKIFKKKGSKISIFKDPNIRDLEHIVADKTGLSVIIKNNKRNKGTITFVYKDNDQLNKIIEIIKSNY